MTKSEQLLARRSLHSKDFLHFVCFFPIDFVIVNPELSQWTIEKSDSFVRNKDYKHSEMVFFCYPISLKKKGAYNFHGSKKINLPTSTGSIASAASYTHFGQNWQMPQPSTDIGETARFWPSKSRKAGIQAWGHEKSHLAGKRPWIRKVKQLNI